MMANCEKKEETVKWLTMQHSFKKKALPFKIPTSPSSQDSTHTEDDEDTN